MKTHQIETYEVQQLKQCLEVNLCCKCLELKKKSQIHNLPCSLKKLEKEGQATPPAIRRKEITKHSVEMNREQENIRENQPKR